MFLTRKPTAAAADAGATAQPSDDAQASGGVVQLHPFEQEPPPAVAARGAASNFIGAEMQKLKADVNLHTLVTASARSVAEFYGKVIARAREAKIEITADFHRIFSDACIGIVAMDHALLSGLRGVYDKLGHAFEETSVGKADGLADAKAAAWDQ
jgi:hypothetical protein